MVTPCSERTLSATPTIRFRIRVCKWVKIFGYDVVYVFVLEVFSSDLCLKLCFVNVGYSQIVYMVNTRSVAKDFLRFLINWFILVLNSSCYVLTIFRLMNKFKVKVC
ncbi:hypothetical protein HanXRQr2_Chr04g0182761 [Helianthus annuus]|uniref:Uncharacterized protein n=1 Tax=Helianthus annuus TaxID=4232 RepID=A0A9K3JA26_HELAN|nr:hypothetical protein HanXRQr2_Chr04g0182761 [Helianthus annuus]